MEEYYLLAVDGIIWLLNSIARHPALWICSFIINRSFDL